MNINRKKISQRIVNAGLAFCLVLSSVSTAVPVLLADTAFAVATIPTSVANLASTVASAAPGDVIDITTSGTISSKVVINKPLTLTSSNGSVIDVAPTDGLNAIGIQSNNVTIENLTFQSNWNFGNGAVIRALEVSSHTDITIKNNSFKNLRQPAYINDNTTGTIQGNYTDITKGWVILSNTDLVFNNNTWGENVLDVAIIEAATNNYSDPEVIAISDDNHNATVENQFGPTNRLSDAYVTPASNGRAGDEASEWNPTTSIQTAVDRIVTGGTVKVAAGTYATGANINKTAVMKGAQSGNTGVGRTHGAASESRVIGTTTYSPTFAVNAPNVVIDGFDFGPNTDGASSGPVGVDLGSSAGATVKNSIFSHNQRGISLSGATNVMITDSLFDDNNSSAPNNNASIWGDSVNTITIKNSELNGASNTAINLAGSKNITIKNNMFNDNGNTAVIWNDEDVTFSNNYGRNFSGTGVFITGSKNVDVLNNDLATGATFSGVSISTASGNPSSNVRVNDNTISGFLNGVSFTGASALSDTLVVRNNKLAGNSNAGVNGPTAASIRINATNNWWGAANGPSDTVNTDNSVLASNPGSGSAARGAVRYTAWCLTDACASYSDATLAAPTNLTPPTGTVTNDKNFGNSWTAVAGAAGYEYQTSYTSDGTNLGSIIYNDSSAANPSRYNLTGSTVYRTNIDTPNATYYWQVRTVNAEGVAGPWSVINKVTVDTIAPVVTINTPAGSLTANSNFDVNFTLTDNFALNALSVYVTDTAGNYKTGCASATNLDAYPAWVTNYSSTCTVDISGLAEGNYILIARGQDRAGNYAVDAKRSLTVDKTAPTITVKDGYVGTLASKIFSDVSFKLYDQYQVDKYVINSFTSDFTNSQWSDANFQNIKSKLVQGTNTLTLYDVAGNSTTYVFTYDTVAPALPVHEFPGNNAFINMNDFWFEWSDASGATKYETQYSQDPATGSNGAFVSVAWTGDYQQIQPTTSKAHSVGANGTWYWQVRAIDDAGNKSAWTAPWKLTIDMVAPSAPALSLRAGSTDLVSGGFTNSYTVKALWNAPAGEPVAYDYKYWNTIATSAHNGEANAWFNNGLSGTELEGVFNQGEGTHYIQVRAIDAAGNKSAWSNTFEITYDSTAPSVTLDSSNTVGNVITPVITVNDTNGPLTYNWSGSNPGVTLSATNVLTPDFTVTTDGTYAYDVTVTDRAGNTTTKTFTFSYTTPAPAVVPFSQPASIVPTQTTTNVTGAATGFANVALNDAPQDDTPAVQGANTQDDDSNNEDNEEVLGTTVTPKQNANGDFAPLGLSWYWWLPIVAAGGGLAWWLFALMRRNSED